MAMLVGGAIPESVKRKNVPPPSAIDNRNLSPRNSAGPRPLGLPACARRRRVFSWACAGEREPILTAHPLINGLRTRSEKGCSSSLCSSETVRSA
jgi:hypothetical protein